MNCNKAYNSYKDWWFQYGNWKQSFEDHINEMSLHEFMELMNNWNTDWDEE
jgi:hypothetical protein